MPVVRVSFFQIQIGLNPDHHDKHFINWKSTNRSDRINKRDFVNDGYISYTGGQEIKEE